MPFLPFLFNRPNFFSTVSTGNVIVPICASRMVSSSVNLYTIRMCVRNIFNLADSMWDAIAANQRRQASGCWDQLGWWTRQYFLHLNNDRESYLRRWSVPPRYVRRPNLIRKRRKQPGMLISSLVIPCNVSHANHRHLFSRCILSLSRVFDAKHITKSDGRIYKNICPCKSINARY